MHIITGRREASHITPRRDADYWAAIAGTKDDFVVAGVGHEFALEVVSNNEIVMSSGQLVMCGVRAAIDFGETETFAIKNGTQGTTRNDLIVCRYEKDMNSLFETTTEHVIEGPNNSGDPAVTTGDMSQGAVKHEMLLYRIRLNGINIVGVDKLFNVRAASGNTPVPYTLLASKWSGGIYTITEPWIGEREDMELYPVAVSTMSPTERAAWDAGQIWPISQKQGELKLAAPGAVPVVNLPIVLKWI